MRLAALAIAFGLLTACEAPREPYHRTVYTFGTLASIQLYDLPRERALEVANKIERRLSTLNKDWYAWGKGELGQLNRALANAEKVALSASLAALIQRSLELRDLSAGRFDPAIGSLVELWGFHDSGQKAPAQNPAAGDIQARAELLGIEVVQEDEQYYLQATRTGIVIDLGGIAKGAALAECARLLKAEGVRRALIDLGGDLIALSGPDQAAFRIGVKDPRDDALAGLIRAQDGEAVVSSGDYERYYEKADKRYHHIIDPETGYPTATAIAVTVISKDAILADAAATALMVAGPQHFEAVNAALGIKTAVLIAPDGEYYLTPDMRERLELKSLSDAGGEGQ